MFIQIATQLLPDLMSWAESNHIDWSRVLRSWIQELFMSMKRQCVNRLWSILFFEGYGALLPLTIAILSSNKSFVMNLPAMRDPQLYVSQLFMFP